MLLSPVSWMVLNIGNSPRSFYWFPLARLPNYYSIRSLFFFFSYIRSANRTPPPPFVDSFLPIFALWEATSLLFYVPYFFLSSYLSFDYSFQILLYPLPLNICSPLLCSLLPTDHSPSLTVSPIARAEDHAPTTNEEVDNDNNRATTTKHAAIRDTREKVPSVLDCRSGRSFPALLLG